MPTLEYPPPFLPVTVDAGSLGLFFVFLGFFFGFWFVGFLWCFLGWWGLCFIAIDEPALQMSPPPSFLLVPFICFESIASLSGNNS